MNLIQFGLILKARRWLILAFVVAGLLGGLLWAIGSPKRYVATAQLLITARAPDSVAVAGQTPDVVQQLQPDYLSTQADVIKSDRVAIAAVKRLGIDSDPDALTEYRQSGSSSAPDTFFAHRLQSGLRVLPATASRVISIAYLSGDPANSARVANAFADAYQDVSLQLQVEPARQASSFYQSSAAALRKQLDDAQARLSKRRAELGVTAVNDQSADAEDARLAALTSQLAGAEGAQAVASARVAGGAAPDAMASPVVQNLQGEIARLEGQRSQLATFAGPNNPDYRQIVGQLAQLRTQLAEQMGRVRSATTTSSTQSAQSVAQLRAEVNSARGRVIASQRDRGEIASLEQDVQTLKNTYEQLVARQAQSTLLGGTVQTNVSTLAPATPPTGPAGLPPTLKIVMGLVLGTIVGFALALALEFLDQRLRRPEDAPIWLGIPNLGGVRLAEPRPAGLIGASVRRYLPRPNEEDAR